jgi:hypothetical protein
MANLYKVQFQVKMPDYAFPTPAGPWTSSPGHTSKNYPSGPWTVFLHDFLDRETGSRWGEKFSEMGLANAYRRPARSVLVLAASQAPKDLAVPLGNNVNLQSGEEIEILAVNQIHLGTEGSAVLQ